MRNLSRPTSLLILLHYTILIHWVLLFYWNHYTWTLRSLSTWESCVKSWRLLNGVTWLCSTLDFSGGALLVMLDSLKLLFLCQEVLWAQDWHEGDACQGGWSLESAQDWALKIRISCWTSQERMIQDLINSDAHLRIISKQPQYQILTVSTQRWWQLEISIFDIFNCSLDRWSLKRRSTYHHHIQYTSNCPHITHGTESLPLNCLRR